MTEQVAEFVDLLNFENDYEILNVHPYTIRKKSNHYIISESLNDKGYPRLKLNGKDYYKHRIVALQFIPNPENLPFIDHCNRDRTDYHIENLRWCNNSINCKNKSSNCNIQYTYVDEIDENSIMINDYGKHHFEGYYYDETVSKFFFDNGIQYRELHINVDKRDGQMFVCMMTTENKRIRVYYSKFKKLYDLK